MLESEYKTLLTKLILIEEEFKRNYNNKLYNTYGNNYRSKKQMKQNKTKADCFVTFITLDKE